MTISNVNLFFRNLWQNKLYTGITVFGFAFSLTFVILLGAYIRQELAVDQFHKNKDRIFRAIRTWEEARRANAFPRQLKKMLRNPGYDWTLEAGTDGNSWTLYRLDHGKKVEAYALKRAEMY